MVRAWTECQERPGASAFAILIVVVFAAVLLGWI